MQCDARSYEINIVVSVCLFISVTVCMQVLAVFVYCMFFLQFYMLYPLNFVHRYLHLHTDTYKCVCVCVCI